MTVVISQFTDRRVRADRLKSGDQVQLDDGSVWPVAAVLVLDDLYCAVQLGRLGKWYVRFDRAEPVRVTGLVPR